MIICSAAMSLGTLLGGKRIIKSVAMDMVSLEKYQGVAASLSTVITLFVASMTGMPVSTSHCSTASIMGVGASKKLPPRELGRRPPHGVGLGAHLPLLRIYRLGLGQAVHDAVRPFL